MPETTISTTLTESVNIVLANVGESPVNSITGVIPVQVSLALNTIEEVSADVQSKGWWFNQNSSYDVNGVATGTYAVTNDITIRPSDVSNDWHDGIPEEARRYITIRASRIAQTRLVGSEELQKFSYNEELVSLAILQQAHVRNSDGVLDFNEFPTELKGLGVDEVMFLQGNVEEKIGTLRLGGELANIAKTKAETALVAEQERLVEKQVTTEEKAAEKVQAEKALIDAQELKTDAEKSFVDAQTQTEGYQQGVLSAQTSNIGADSTLKGKQGSLVDKQALDVEADTTLKGKQGDFLDSQKTELDAKTAIDVGAEKAFYDGVVAGTQDTYRDYAAEMRMMGIQESTFQQTPAYKKVELLKDAVKLRTSTATETNQNSDEIEQVNKVLRFIGEPPIITLGDNALASETARLLRDTDAELQGRGWWFNTRKNVEFEPYQGVISFEDNVLSIEVDGIPTHISRYGSGYRLFNRDTNSTTSWTSTIKATVIYKKSLSDVPTKYLEYLNVRTAILLTELYPQSGIDIQRLPKMEQELRAYFKDRQNDEANYTVFDNYDAASRLGVNRNYSIL
jgi:hypothetical protein